MLANAAPGCRPCRDPIKIAQKHHLFFLIAHRGLSAKEVGVKKPIRDGYGAACGAGLCSASHTASDHGAGFGR